MIEVVIPNDSDYDLMFLWRNHELIRSASRVQDEISLDDHLCWVKRLAERPHVRLLMLCIDRERIGVGRLELQGKAAEFSIYLNPDYIGKRFGEAAVRALLKFGFDGLGLHFIWGDTHKGNYAAQRTFLKAGLNRRDENGDWIRYDLSRTEWKAWSQAS